MLMNVSEDSLEVLPQVSPGVTSEVSLGGSPDVSLRVVPEVPLGFQPLIRQEFIRKFLLYKLLRKLY